MGPHHGAALWAPTMGPHHGAAPWAPTMGPPPWGPNHRPSPVATKGGGDHGALLNTQESLQQKTIHYFTLKPTNVPVLFV